MSRKADLVTLAVAIVVHSGLVVVMSRGHKPERPRTRTVELEYKKPAAPPPVAADAGPPAPDAPEAAPPARRKVAMRSRPTPAPPPRAAATPPPTAPARPAPPVFGVSMASTTELGSGPAVAIGSTTNADPTVAGRSGGRRGGVPGGTGRDPVTGDGDYQPASELEVATMPEIDADACGRTVTYPSEAEQAGIEGDVRLRVSLNERGGVHAVRVLKGLGHGLDRVAIEAIKHRCKFTPAIAKSGKPVAFVVESYTFHFELPR